MAISRWKRGPRNRTNGRAGFPADYLKAPRDGVELKVSDGRLWIKNALVHPRYLGSDSSFADADGYIDTRDGVRVDGDRCYFLGRIDGTINVGGNKVRSEEVEGVLLSHREVCMASVSGKKNPITGNIVVAKVVASEGADRKRLVKELRAICAERLEKYKRPASIRLVESLDISSSGKISRS